MPDFEVHLFVGQLEAVRMTIARPDMATAQEWATKLISGSFEFDRCELWEDETKLAILNPVRTLVSPRPAA